MDAVYLSKGCISFERKWSTHPRIQIFQRPTQLQIQRLQLHHLPLNHRSITQQLETQLPQPALRLAVQHQIRIQRTK